MISVDDEFQKLLTQIRDNQLKRLNLSTTFGEEGTCEIVKELKGNKSVQRVTIYGPIIAGVLSDVLKVNTSISTIDLWNNNFGSEGARAIAEALKVNQNVKDFYLGNNNLGLDGARAIGEMLSVNKTLKYLYLTKNNLGPDGARHIAEALKVNQSVKILCLTNNDIGTEGAEAIAEALKVNCVVGALYLGNNNIGAEGSRALLDVLEVNGSLKGCFVGQFWAEMNAVCERNIAIEKEAKESVIHLLALRRMRRITWIQNEMMVMIGQMLWKTKCDVEAWNKQNNDKHK